MLIRLINRIDKKILTLAFPILVANISIPILGLTDTAVIGQLGDIDALAGISIGAVLIGSIYWFFGFLRMGVTGLIAQAAASKDKQEISDILARGLIIAGLGGGALVMIQFLLFPLIFYFFSGEPKAENLAYEYMSIRIIAAPFAISVFVFVGWLFGMGKTFNALILLVSINLLNIILDIFFVKVLQLSIHGVAFATILAEVFGFIFGLYLSREFLLGKNFLKSRELFSSAKWFLFIKLNINIVVRSILLQTVFLSYLFFGSLFGSVILSANHILIQIIGLSAYALDGIAFSTEILVGRAVGKRNNVIFDKVKASSLKLGCCFSIVIAVFFYIFHFPIINLMTSIENVRLYCYEFRPWIVLMPLLSVYSYIYDGIFLGAACGREIRVAMVQSFFTFAVCVITLVPYLENDGLWAAIIIFNVTRGLTLHMQLRSLRQSI